MIKYGGETLHLRLHQLILDIQQKEEEPEDCKMANYIPIHKKGDKMICQNYRGIVLLMMKYKLFSTILACRMTPYMEEVVGDYQCGFRKNRSTTDQIFAVRQILDKFYEDDVDIHTLFIDFKQAYDNIYRNILTEILYSVGIPIKLVRLVEMSLTHTKGKVIIQGSTMEEFIVDRVLKQDAISTILFNIVLENVISRLPVTPKGTIFNRMTECIAYADDIVILGRGVNYLKEVFEELK
jgi:sorting nexin-29